MWIFQSSCESEKAKLPLQSPGCAFMISLAQVAGALLAMQASIPAAGLPGPDFCPSVRSLLWFECLTLQRGISGRQHGSLETCYVHIKILLPNKACTCTLSFQVSRPCGGQKKNMDKSSICCGIQVYSLRKSREAPGRKSSRPAPLVLPCKTSPFIKETVSGCPQPEHDHSLIKDMTMLGQHFVLLSTYILQHKGAARVHLKKHKKWQLCKPCWALRFQITKILLLASTVKNTSSCPVFSDGVGSQLLIPLNAFSSKMNVLFIFNMLWILIMSYSIKF